jgi:signal transduction histidine kinase
MESRVRFLCFFMLLMWIRVAYAQTYKVIRYNINDSLVASAVNDISQDSAGFIWVATNNGLLRYTGEYFTPVLKDTLTYLSYESKSFLVAHHKLLRIENQYPFDKIDFESLPVSSSGKLSKERVLITRRGGFWWSDNEGIHSLINKKQTDFRLIASPRSSEFFLAELHDLIIAISVTGEFYYLRQGGNTFIPVVGGNMGSRVNDVLTFSDTTLAVATDDGLSMLKITGKDMPGRTVLSGGTKFTHLTKDRSANLWASTMENKLIKFYASGNSFVPRQIQDGTEPHRISELRFREIRKLFIDRNDNLWICHTEGLAMISEIPFVVVDPELPNEIVRSVAFMDEGRAYLSGIAGLFETVNKGFNDYEVRAAHIGNNIYPHSVCRCGSRLWLGTVDDEIYFYERGKISRPFHSRNASNIFYIFCDTVGDVWVSRGQKFEPIVGIMKISKDLQIKEYDRKYGFSTRMLVTKQDSRGTVYTAGIGDTTYLYRYDRKRDRFVNVSVPMKFDHGDNFEVHDFAVTDDSTFWLASTAGLLQLKGDSIRKVSLDELYGREVVAVTLSKDQVVWASTEKDGLIRYVSDDDYAIFNIEAGLQSGIMWYRSLFTDAEGKLWAGSREGITVSSHPDPQPRKTEVPLLLQVFDNGVSNIRKHVFNFATTLTIQFTSLNYPTRTIEYEYKINHDSTWRHLRGVNKLILGDLESGNYTVNIRARQSGGFYWSDPLVYSFTILKPWYLSREAYLIYFIFLCVIIVLGTRIYNRRLIREKNRLELKVLERTRELVKKQEEIIAQNQELQQLSDVLAVNHDNIVSQKEIIEKQNFLLHQSKAELEKKVEERTQELQVSNEELAQQNVQLEQFAFMTAHNLRAPVARLLGLTSLLEVNGSRDPEENELLRRIRESSRTLDETIREISEILHIKKGLHGSFTNVNLRVVWDRILPTFNHEIESNKIMVNSCFDIHHVIRGIEPFVYSVFYNIISNSIKYADDRKRSYIKVTCGENDRFVIATFEDNGIGFNSALYADKLFKPFTRFNNLKEGRGLGLYLMKIQMEMMGGDIQLISHLDVGTTITLHFEKAK